MACGLPRKIRKLVTDSNRADRTTPHRINWVGASWRPVRETRNTAAMAPSAPSTLPTDRAHTPSDANAPNSSTAVAPTLAPEDTPSRNGSARALRTSACTTVPAVVSAAPTTAASSTRGRRICQTISSRHRVGLRVPEMWSTTTCQTAAGLSATDPIATPRVIVTTRSTAQPASTRREGETVTAPAPGSAEARWLTAVLPFGASLASSSVDRRTSGSGSPAGRRTHRP